jgi:TolB protein
VESDVKNSVKPSLLLTVLVLGIFSGPVIKANAREKVEGIFESHGDVGKVLHSGSVEYDAAKRAYTVAGSGENMWFGTDAFHFVWKKVAGDATLTADISFLGTGGNAHRKAVLMIRQNLDGDSAYADIALHGNGLTALQFRDEKGAITQEVQSLIQAPKRLRIEKLGAYFTMWLSGETGELQMAGATPRIELKEPFYVGIGVCSHDKDAVEKAIFSNVDLTSPKPVSASTAKREDGVLYSFLETVPVDSTDRTAIYISRGRFEAPNWTRDGKAFLFNRDGRILRLPVRGDKPETIDTGFAIRCNNDHGISPDSTQLVISDQSQEDHKSLVYVLPITGGTPKRITKNSPSYWHGWSPDGKTLAFVGQRNDEFDIYAIPVTGGEETRLTTAKGLDDGPEYSPDGQYIYFNSERTGRMQIWRMKADGSEQEQVFSDDNNNWFPHISPDGKFMVFLTFDKSVSGHPENQDVMLRLLSLSDKKIKTLAKLFGGQGTINVPSWSPDSKTIAFVSYAVVQQTAN